MKVIYFGSIGIAKRILEEIVLKKDVDLIGICCKETINRWRNEESVYDFAIKHGIPIIEHGDILSLNADLGISVRYNRIIEKQVIESFRFGIVNTHGGILPEYRGSYCNINAIINNEKEYGVTLHYIQPGVDDGDIIDIKKIEISENHTGFDLYKESEKLCYEIIKDNIDSLLNGTNKRISQKTLIEDGHACNEYKRSETIQAKDLTDIAVDDPRWIRVVRAFDSPFHEPAFLRIGDRKVYLRVRYDDLWTNTVPGSI